MKKELEKRFKNLFKNKRLLAIQLDGFSHRVIFDNGTAKSSIQSYNYSAYTPIENADLNEKLKVLFLGCPHYSYQNNAQELIYILPNER